MSMNTVDFCCFLVLLVLTARGAWVGLVNEWAGLLGIFLGYFLSVMYAPGLDLWCQNVFELSFDYSLTAARVFIFLISYVVFKILGSFLTKILKLVWLNWINRALGGASGAFKAVVFLSVFFTVYNSHLIYFFDQAPLMGDSLIFRAVEMFSAMFFESFLDIELLQPDESVNA